MSVAKATEPRIEIHDLNDLKELEDLAGFDEPKKSVSKEPQDASEGE